MSSASLRAEEAAPRFAALGDPTRLQLLITLSDGRTRSIASLSANSRVTRQAVTKHLRVLEQAGLVARSREGRESRYALRDRGLVEARAFLDGIAGQWEDALLRLRDHLEQEQG